MLLNCGVVEDSWESLGLQGNQTSQSLRKSSLNIHWKDWCWSWNSNTLATWCKELTHWKRPWCWERLRAGGEGGDREWDGWMASPTQWTWVWASSGSWWWTGKPGVLQSMASQRVRQDWATELNWILCCVAMLHFVYPFISWCTFELFPLWVSYTQMLLWTFEYKFLCGHMFSFLLDISLGLEMLDHV